MLASLLLLADSRLPAGGHAHSGGLEPAVAAGWIRGIGDVDEFLHGRLHSTGAVAAGCAALACRAAAAASPRATDWGWARLEGAFDARTPAPAARSSSRAQGRALLRVAKTAWPSPLLHEVGREPHHACLLGVVVQIAGGSAADAARLAALSAVSGPASAAVRLLSLDPLQVQAMLVRLSPDVDRVATDAVADAERGDLASPGSPALDLLAECHAATEVRLFAS